MEFELQPRLEGHRSRTIISRTLATTGGEPDDAAGYIYVVGPDWYCEDVSNALNAAAQERGFAELERSIGGAANPDDCDHDWRQNPRIAYADMLARVQDVCIRCGARRTRSTLTPDDLLRRSDPQRWPKAPE
jgi:hypothetical protein